ncbi:MAG: carbamoyl-phosphate synthase large subunit [Gammaproteobacteria bacterium]|nr:carbamoyl-phosphate synthase large subunit [Gammaproteobacteria bacterium]
MNKLLIANRGEIAIRIARAAAELGITTVAVYAEEDAQSLHRSRTDEAVRLEGRGAKAYLDVDQLVATAQQNHCDAVHPGYGFLSENAEFAARVEAAGITFVGPTPETLALLGDKVNARKLAEECGIALLAGSTDAVALEEARSFFASLPDGTEMFIKAVAGGGGRGMRVVRDANELEEAFARCTSEAQHAFGNPAVYVEEYLANARHVEVQILGDGTGAVSHLWERECSIQRRHQKIVEVAPSPSLHDSVRLALTSDAVRLGEAVAYRSLGTVEFLIDGSGDRYTFIEVNARLQVEHTVTEEVTGIDLVRAQLEIASGRTLAELELDQANIPAPRGCAIQARINMETLLADGTTKPGGGTLSVFEVPTGPGLRTDTYGYAGYTTSPAFDSLLAKLIVHSPSNSYADAVRKAYRALCETRIEGVPTNLGMLRNLFAQPQFLANEVHTGFIEDHVEQLVANGSHRVLHAGAPQEPAAAPELAGAKVDEVDPLAVLDHGKSGAASVMSAPQALALVDEDLPEGTTAIKAPMQGTIVSFDVAPGDEVYDGKQVLVMEAMKMEHVVNAEVSGIVQRLGVNEGDTVFEGHPLIYLQAADIAIPEADDDHEQDLDYVRPDLQEVYDRKAAGYDENRPEAVAKRRKTGHRTARENVADLCDDGTFVEYGSIVVAGQRRRRSMEDLIKNTTGDGMVCGLGQVNGHLFGENQARTMIMSYDYMVLAGTQGMKNHAKKDRLFEMAEQYRLPTVLFAEGGGGRPGDTDGSGVAGLDCWAFTYFARLSGLVPIVGITTGRCFAGNAVLLACCDVIIATEDSNIGIGGPAMIEGGGLGIFKPEEVGPMAVQVPNGVVDILVKDEAEAVAVTKQYLSYFQGAIDAWEAPDDRKLRFIVPENRLRYYDMREVVETIADIGSVLEIREQWGPGIITSFIRVEGRPIGVIANNPGHLSGAIDSEGADKGARFMQLCDAFDIPILSLCDCPGIMVGPESEKTALVRHAGRMFVVGANIDVPLMTIVTRKAYGLGAQAMAGGSFKLPLFTVTWPTGEFGGMGLEGAVKLGYRKELQAIEDPEERKTTYEKMVRDMYQRGKAVNMASHFELDDVIDPADSRKWISRALSSVPPAPPRTHKKRPNVDTW